MNEKQKKTKITNTIAALRTKGTIVNTGNDFKSNWILKSSN